MAQGGSGVSGCTPTYQLPLFSCGDQEAQSNLTTMLGRSTACCPAMWGLGTSGMRSSCLLMCSINKNSAPKLHLLHSGWALVEWCDEQQRSCFICRTWRKTVVVSTTATSPDNSCHRQGCVSSVAWRFLCRELKKTVHTVTVSG